MSDSQCEVTTQGSSYDIFSGCSQCLNLWVWPLKGRRKDLCEAHSLPGLQPGTLPGGRTPTAEQNTRQPTSLSFREERKTTGHSLPGYTEPENAVVKASFPRQQGSASTLVTPSCPVWLFDPGSLPGHTLSYRLHSTAEMGKSRRGM